MTRGHDPIGRGVGRVGELDAYRGGDIRAGQQVCAGIGFRPEQLPGGFAVQLGHLANEAPGEPCSTRGERVAVHDDRDVAVGPEGGTQAGKRDTRDGVGDGARNRDDDRDPKAQQEAKTEQPPGNRDTQSLSIGNGRLIGVHRFQGIQPGRGRCSMAGAVDTLVR